MIFYKTMRGICGVWPVKRLPADEPSCERIGIRHWSTELDAWQFVRDEACRAMGDAQKALDKANRDFAKALKKLEALRCTK